jgi:predicted Rossmann-fold nucleotide-binding protein
MITSKHISPLSPVTRKRLSNEPLFAQNKAQPTTPLPKTATPSWLDAGLKLAIWLDSKAVPNLVYPLVKLVNPKLTKNDVIYAVKGNPYSLSNIFYRLKYPRVLGVNVYGSARPTKTNALSHHYQLGLQAGKALTEAGLFPVTGGGPGVMQAVAEGAYRANGHTVGVGVTTLGEMDRAGTSSGLNKPFEDNPLNIYRELVLSPTFTHRLKGPGGFFHRAGRNLILPGGLGTIRETLEAFDEIAYSDELSHFPLQKQLVVLDENGYYKNTLKPLLDTLIKEKVASPSVYKVLRFVSSLPEAINALNDPSVPWTTGLKNHQQRNLKYKPFSLSALAERLFHALHRDVIQSNL